MVAESIYFDGTYKERNPTWHEEDSPWKAAQIADLLKANSVRPQRIAEIGCGVGVVLQELLELQPGATGVGYDIAPEPIAIARSREGPRLSFHCGDFFDTEEVFDLLLCINVFEHVDDYLGFLHRLRGHARHYAFHIPLDMHVSGLLRDTQIVSRKVAGHLHYFSQATALATLRDTGYDIKAWRYTRSEEDLAAVRPDRGPRSKIGNMIRRSLRSVVGDGFTAKLLGGYCVLVLATCTGKAA